MLIRRSFSRLTIAELRYKQGIKNLIISGARLDYLCEKYDIGRIDCALLMKVPSDQIDEFGRIIENT